MTEKNVKPILTNYKLNYQRVLPMSINFIVLSGQVFHRFFDNQDFLPEAEEVFF